MGRPRFVSVRGALGLKGALAAGLLLLGLGTGDAAARTRCSYSGPPENLLTVRADKGLLTEIARRGHRIVVSELFLEPRIRCAGGVPTVLNTDTIRVNVASSDVTLRLAGGPFAPGATAEAEGAPEIEIQLSGGGEASASLVGTRHADEFHWGAGLDVRAGLNLNPSEAGDQDVDVTLERRFALLSVQGGGGNDIIVSPPGAVFPMGGVLTASEGGRGNDHLTTPPNSGGVVGGFLQGGKGNDVLIGGSLLDFLEGESGSDRLEAGRGDDRLVGGPGRDLMLAGPGRDRVHSRESTRDRVRCGAGRDRVRADRRDRLRGCEFVDR